MSGFLPDIARWALGGGAGGAGGNGDGDGDGSGGSNSNDNNGNNNDGNANANTLSEEEIRAKRMARLAALENRQSSSASACTEDAVIAADSENGADSANAEKIDNMEIDGGDEEAGGSGRKIDNISGGPRPMDVDDVPGEKKMPAADATIFEPAPKKQAKETTATAAFESKSAPATPLDPVAEAARKLRRKKLLLLRRVLLVTIASPADDASSPSSDKTAACVKLVVDDPEIACTADNDVGGGSDGDVGTGFRTHHIAEILASRLSLSPSAKSLETMPPQHKCGIIGYLGGCYKRAGEEWKEVRNGLNEKKSKSSAGGEEDLLDILEEIRKQVVSYAASSLMVPDLFELGNDSTLQLAKCLCTTTTNPTNSITFDVLGKNTSFYYNLCEELHSQDVDSFQKVITEVAKYLTDSLSKCDTILDEPAAITDSNTATIGDNGLFLVSALRELCTHKKATAALANTPRFHLPPADSPEASVKVTPTMPRLPTGASAQQARLFHMMQAMSNSRAGYLRRSGPALEKETLLGLVLRLGLPAEHPSVTSTFSNAASKTKKDVSNGIEGLRRQLELYQNKCNELVKQLVIAGEDSRKNVIQWFIDALLVNVNAGASRPDRTKVSSPELLLNLSVVLLKLCEPFFNDTKKSLLIDPGFVSSPENHGGIYDLTGNDHLPRLGSNVTNSALYQPKNSFIPLCFFFCSRSLALSIIPDANFYDMIVYQARRTAWTIQRQNGDIRSDPNLNRYLGIQYAKEIHLQNRAYVTDILKFYDMAAGFLMRIDKDQLTTMPEHIVNDFCDVLNFASEQTPKMMAGIDFGNSFRLSVTLLSQDYAGLVRNYNLRAKLGDVLHDIFLPDSANNRSDVPASVTCDPFAGGQPYLTSDKLSQETLAPSLLLLYGEVEHTGFYDKNSHRTKIAELLKFLWDSPEHKPAFRRITEDKASFIKFANGIVNEMNHQFASVMERLPAIRTVQLQMANPQQWAALSEEERETITSRHEENEQHVKRDLPLCNSIMKMLGFLNTDKDIRDMFLLDEMRSRLANMLLHVLTKLVGSRGLDLKVDNPETYNFRPKEMLQDLCIIFSSFADADEFQKECARSGYYTTDLMSKAVKTCRKLGLLVGESMELFDLLATKVEDASKMMESDEDLYEDAPDEFLDELMCTFMIDPVILPTSGKIVDRQTITQHLLNDSTDPFNRKELSVGDIVPAVELKEKMEVWLEEKRAARNQSS